MVEYSFETVGYFSVINGVLEEPILKTLNIAAVKRINHDGIPLDCNRQTPVAKNWDTTRHLLQFLRENRLINNNSFRNEYNVLSRASDLLKLLAVEEFYKEPERFEFYKANIGNTTVIEKYRRGDFEFESKEKLSPQSETVERMLALLPNGLRERIPGLYPLFIVVKHIYVFPNGAIINLFVSKEIHSVIENNGELTPIDLKYNIRFWMATAPRMVRRLWKSIVMSFLVGGISHLMAVNVPKVDFHVQRVVLIDDKTALCDNRILNNFTETLCRFLRKLVEVNYDGLLVKLPEPPQDILISTEPDSWITLFSAAPTESAPINYELENQIVDHQLVILGTCRAPIAYPNHFYNADFITLKHFCQGLFTEFLRKPEWIKFYGTKEEYERVQYYMTEEQLDKLILMG